MLTLTLFLLALSSQQIADSNLGTVEGVVVDSDNKAVKGASVYADNLNFPVPGRPDTVQTDDQGHFVLHNVTPGRIIMRAYKDADKYPKISFTFDEPIGEADPELQMKARDAYKGIVIRLGHRAGSLQLHVVNATTGEPIGAISWQICRGDHPGDDGYCVSGSTPGDYRLSVPSSAPMSIKITVPNYSEWTYQDSANKTPYLAIAAGEDRTLTVNLQPLGKQ